MSKAQTSTESTQGANMFSLAAGTVDRPQPPSAGRLVSFNLDGKDKPANGGKSVLPPPASSVPGKVNDMGQSNISHIPRPFKPADIAIIRALHNTMSGTQLLKVLNNRLFADLGPDAPAYTMKMLSDKLGELIGENEVVGVSGWADLRKLISQARRDGTMDLISEQVIHDFAVVFQLNEKQFIYLKEVLLSDPEGEEE